MVGGAGIPVSNWVLVILPLQALKEPVGEKSLQT